MSTPLNQDERTLRARVAAHTLHATHDPHETTAAARAAFLARFEDQVDPERVLPAGERQRRARHALKAHMSRLALASAKARRQERTARGEEELDALLG